MGTLQDVWRRALFVLALPLLVGQPLVGIGGVNPEASWRTDDDASMLAQVSQAVLADEPYNETAKSALQDLWPPPSWRRLRRWIRR